MLENLVNQVIGKGARAPEALETRRVRASARRVRSPRVSVHSSPGKPEVRKQRAVPLSQVPQTQTISTQLRKVCFQSMRTAGFKGILVVPMSCQVGRARAGCM